MNAEGRPLAIDLFTGLHGWSAGLVAAGWDVVGFDIEDMCGQFGVPRPEHVQLVLQDVRTIDGAQFRDARLIVASPPCQEFSYMAMPWSRAKQIARALRGEDEFPDGYRGSGTVAELTALFDACFRIQREASEAAGRHIPLIVENVRGAIPWVGRSRWNYGSFHLWGDVPALMPPAVGVQKVPGFRFDGSGRSFQTASVAESGIKAPGMNWSDRTKRGQDFTRLAGVHALSGVKNTGGSWFNVGSPGQKEVGRNPVHDFTRLAGRHAMDGTKVGGDWFSDPQSPSRMSGSKSSARKAASAAIAKIPFPLANHIARVYLPTAELMRADG